MGVFDAQIADARKQIDIKRSQIAKLKKKIRELEEILEKCDSIQTKVSETIGNLFHTIDRRGSSIKGNFVSYYKKNIEKIVRKNGIYEVEGQTSNDKRQIKNKIISYEDQIQQLYREINALESESAYYQANNTEPETQVE